MERHIDRIRVFKAMASPSYMAMTYVNDPVEHAFNMAKRAELGMRREPEFKSDFIEIGRKCKAFAVAVLNSCRTSSEVEMVLDDSSKLPIPSFAEHAGNFNVDVSRGFMSDIKRMTTQITQFNLI